MSKTNEDIKWLVALKSNEGLPLGLRVRANVDGEGNRKKYPNLGIISQQLAEVKQNGLPEDAYNATLHDFDLDLQQAATDDGNGFIFLIETFAGKRSYYACLVDELSFRATTDALRLRHPQHVLEIKSLPNVAWKFFDAYRKQYRW